MRSFVIAFCVLSVLLFSCCFGQIGIPTLVQKIKPAVVTIITYDENGDTLSQGSGFFINSKGDVITNYHVLSYANSAEIKTADGRVYSIKNIIAENFNADIIMINLANMKGRVEYLNITTNLPVQGERILVFGSPFGLELTVSDGIVSAIRDIPDFGNIIQITAPISPGSSGGPVVNMKGEVFGVATFQHLEGQNLNFAVPSAMILELQLGKKQPFSEWTTQLIEDLYESAEWLAYTGFVYVWAAEYDSALHYFQRATLKDTLNTDAYFRMGYCYDELGNYYYAIESYKKAISIDSNCALTHNNLGVAYHKSGYYHKAIKACKTAIHIDPNLTEAYVTLGVTYDKLEKPYNAIDAYEHAIRIDSTFSDAYINMALTYGDLGNYDKAIKFCKETIEINPDYGKAHFVLGILYSGLNDTNSALEQYNILATIDLALADELHNIIAEEEPESADLMYLAKIFIGLLVEENYSYAIMYFDDDMKRLLPQNKLRELWWDLIMQIGFFRKQISVRKTEEMDFDVVYVTCEFDEAIIDIKVVFNSAQEVAGLWFVPQ